MSDSLRSEIEHLIDESQIRKLLYTYCRAVDRCDEPLLRSLYHPDAVEMHGGYAGSVDGFCHFAMQTMAWMESGSHQITNVLIELDGDVAMSEAMFISIAAGGTDAAGQKIDLLITGRYLDRFERRAGRWKIARRQVVWDSNHTFSASGRWDGPFYGLFRPRGRPDRSDPLYSFATE
jgi:ketosteroid isomerase-like protein